MNFSRKERWKRGGLALDIVVGVRVGMSLCVPNKAVDGEEGWIELLDSPAMLCYAMLCVLYAPATSKGVACYVNPSTKTSCV
jgi:hypothetical protein